LIFIRTESKGHRVPQATPRRSSSCTSYNAPSRSLGAACSRRRIGHGATSHIFILSSPDGGGTQPRRALSGGARGGKDSATQDARRDFDLGRKRKAWRYAARGSRDSGGVSVTSTEAAMSPTDIFTNYSLQFTYNS